MRIPELKQKSYDAVNFADSSSEIIHKSSVAEPESQGAASFGRSRNVTRCGSGSDGSGSDNGIYHG
jgi:hypothetical protein